MKAIKPFWSTLIVLACCEPLFVSLSLAVEINNEGLDRQGPTSNGNVINDFQENSSINFIAVAKAGANPSIDIEKHTNGMDADEGPINDEWSAGPWILVGETVTWEYIVSNTGNLDLADVAVSDDVVGAINCPATQLVAGDSMTCTVSGTAVSGQYVNVGTVTANPPGDLPPVTDSDPSHYYGVTTSIDIEKHTNGLDVDVPTGPLIPVGEAVTWEYIVRNTGSIPLVNIAVVDNMGTVDEADDVVVLMPADTLQHGAEMTGSYAGVAVAGQYANLATVTASPYEELPPPTDSDPSHYFGANPSIDIEKHTNGVDADLPVGPYIVIGQPVTWEYIVTNTGNIPLTNIAVVDDMGKVDEADDVVVSMPSDTLQPGSEMIGSYSGTAVAGQYSSLATVTATSLKTVPPATDTDPSHYFGVASCNINSVSHVAEIHTKTYEACEILVLGPNFIAADGSNIITNSGWEIDFLPGFLVEQGATLKANICGQSLCMTSSNPMPLGCHTCVDQICAVEPLCCELAFGQSCLDRVFSICGLMCE